jgi:hypothetical protein
LEGRIKLKMAGQRWGNILIAEMKDRDILNRTIKWTRQHSLEVASCGSRKDGMR